MGTRWIPQGRSRWVAEDPALAGFVMRKRWLTSTVGPFVVLGPDGPDRPGEGQCIGYGPSIKAASAAAVAELARMSHCRMPGHCGNCGEPVEWADIRLPAKPGPVSASVRHIDPRSIHCVAVRAADGTPVELSEDTAILCDITDCKGNTDRK